MYWATMKFRTQNHMLVQKSARVDNVQSTGDDLGTWQNLIRTISYLTGVIMSNGKSMVNGS